jgi:hypothetical protein
MLLLKINVQCLFLINIEIFLTGLVTIETKEQGVLYG